MRKPLIWFWMLTKRLYKKVTFVAILVLIPVLVLGYGMTARQDSGMLTVALARQDSDSTALSVLASFEESSQLLRFVDCDSPEGAEELVRAGKADTAWILHSDLSEKVTRFARSPKEKNAFVTVLVREDNVAHRLAREKLSGILYGLCARVVYVDYVRQNVPELAHLSDEQLLDYYENTFEGGELFTFDEADAAVVNVQGTHYLTAPVRGLLAVVVALCGMATAMYHMEDRRRGTFGWLSRTRQSFAELGCQLVSLVQVGAVALLALCIADMAAGMGRELAVLVLYCLCTASFSALLRRLCGSIRVLATVIPLLVVGMLVVCPVFFDLGALRGAQYLLPPTYYIGAVYNDTYLGLMVLHTAATSALYWLLGLLKRD